MECRTRALPGRIARKALESSNIFFSVRLGAALSDLEQPTCLPFALLQRLHVNHEPIFHVALQYALEGLIDLLNGNELNIGNDILRGAEV